MLILKSYQKRAMRTSERNDAKFMLELMGDRPSAQGVPLTKIGMWVRAFHGGEAVKHITVHCHHDPDLKRNRWVAEVRLPGQHWREAARAKSALELQGKIRELLKKHAPNIATILWFDTDKAIEGGN